eukprot:1626268-Amphidinium_carterae.1
MCTWIILPFEPRLEGTAARMGIARADYRHYPKNVRRSHGSSPQLTSQDSSSSTGKNISEHIDSTADP